jgi:hypothetical protein
MTILCACFCEKQDVPILGTSPFVPEGTRDVIVMVVRVFRGDFLYTNRL